MEKLTDLIRIYDNAITPEQCRHYIKCIDEGDQFEGRVSYMDDGISNKVQKQDKVSMDINFSKDYPKEADDILNVVMHYINIYHKDVNHLSPSINAESITGRVYKENTGFYNPHIDRGDPLCIDRVLSILIYLSEVEGGNLVFPKLNFKVKPVPCRLVIFPSDWMYLHGAEMPTKGDRYGIRIFTVGSNHDLRRNTLLYDQYEREQRRAFEDGNLKAVGT